MRFHNALFAASMLALVGCSHPYQKVKTFAEPTEAISVANPKKGAPASAASAQNLTAWSKLSPGLHAAWGDKDIRYPRLVVPTADIADTCRMVAWKGENIGDMLLLWSPDSLSGVTCSFADFKSKDAKLPRKIASANFIRYTVADKYEGKEIGTQVMADMIDSLRVFDMSPRQVRPVWVSLDVPADAKAGIYTSSVKITSQSGKSVTLPLTLEVQKHTLPPARNWGYHLDLWQHPTSVARTQGLKVWSDEHFEAMKPVMKRLADAGQKVITATVNKDPWNHQCYDAYEPMITWTLRADGTWSYDYRIFDRWVQMMMDLGINKMINCYSMVPWNCELEYFDAKTGKTVTVKADPGTEKFTEIWTPFLKDFKKHLDSKGWLGITNIAMDERAPEAMEAAIKVLEANAPEMGFAIADNHKSYKRFRGMRDVCVQQGQTVDAEDIATRRAKGFTTTFYVCCNPPYPNTFTMSDPYEAELLGWYGLASDFDGMLRWAYNSWAADPQTDSRFGNWTSGDTYLVYPYNRSSIRFERMLDGIKSVEKVRILRAAGADTSEVEKVLDEIRRADINDSTLPWRETTAKARKALNAVSRR